MNRFLGGDIVNLSCTVQYSILKGDDWFLDVQHEIARET